MSTRAQKLLAEATPLPWYWDKTMGGIRVDDRYIKTTSGMNERNIWPDAALIVYAVNRLPDYEAAVETLELFVASHEAGYPASLVMSDAACTHARAALARLREVQS